jgi:DNA-directed RNA polymerase specialized sigma24 family protein
MTRPRRAPLSGKVRNAVTESWDEGFPLRAICHLHGLSEERVRALISAARRGYPTPEAEATALIQAKARKALRR